MIDWCAGVLDSGSLGTIESSMTKAAVAETLFQVADRCVQVMGGTGVTGDTVVELIFRELRAFRIYDGPRCTNGRSPGGSNETISRRMRGDCTTSTPRPSLRILKIKEISPLPVVLTQLRTVYTLRICSSRGTKRSVVQTFGLTASTS